MYLGLVKKLYVAEIVVSNSDQVLDTPPILALFHSGRLLV